jgi:MEDS: MEthanogen/methylotroph, DcmR Sensory domain
MPVFECARCNEMSYSASAGSVGSCPNCGSERQRVIEGDFEEARRSLRALGEADHATLVYDDTAAVAPFCARFLTDGVNAGERVVAGTQDDLREAISGLLGPDVELAVEWEDPRLLYGDFDPDRVAATYEALIGGEERTTRILAGLDAQSAQSVDQAELDRYETLAHRIVTDHGATVVCLYDTRALAPGFLDVSACRHGLTIEDGAVRRNERFEYQPA